ncbi:MAG: sporulation protein YqfD [Bacillota bacterium]
MLRFTLFGALFGFVEISAVGPALEKFVNQAVLSGIFLFDIRLDSGELRAKLLAADFKRLRRAARLTHTRVRLTRKGGLVPLFGRLRRRRAILLGSLGAAALLLFFGTRIWVVEVRGNQKVATDEVFEVLEEAGLKPGASKSALDLRGIEVHLMQRLRQVSWVDIRLDGVRAIVEVAEKSRLPEEPLGPCHVVAAKPGMVEEIIPFSGMPVVRENQMVSQGQVLISGEVVFRAAGDGGQPLEVRQLCRASGIVRARVWYQVYMEMPLTSLQPVMGPGRFVEYFLNVGGREFRLWCSGKPVEGPRWCEVKRLSLPGWRNIVLPVEVTKRVYNQLQYEAVSWPQELVEARAVEEARRNLLGLVPPGVNVTDLRVEVKRAHDFVGVSAMAETIEDIGVNKPLTGGRQGS